MKKLMLAALVMSSSVFAQEIGSEITPATPPPHAATSPNDNPWGAQNSNAQPAQNTPPPPPKPSNAGALSAGSGAFGIRAGFSTPAVGLSGSGSSTSLATGSAGLSYFGGDTIKMLFDVGFGLGVVGSNANFAVSAGIGLDYLARTPFDALRPAFRAQVGFNLASVGNNVNVGVSVGIGGGADYFFSPNFSVGGRVMLFVPMAFPNGNFNFGLFTLTPGVEATWYF